MAESSSREEKKTKRSLRWWPGVVLVILTLAAVVWVRLQTDWPFQSRNLAIAQIGLVFVILLLLWWTFFSRAANRLRLGLTYGIVGLLIVVALLFRLRGVSGDLMPIFEFRWANEFASPAKLAPAEQTSRASILRFETSDFPQFLGPDRDGVLSGPRLETNWTTHSPQLIWREKVGAAWSGFAVVGDLCITQEQRGEEECVVARNLANGNQLWMHADKARYNNIVSGEGPRATPTVVSNRVFTYGGTGILNCLDLQTGKLLWTRNVMAEKCRIGALPVRRSASTDWSLFTAATMGKIHCTHFMLRMGKLPGPVA